MRTSGMLSGLLLGAGVMYLLDPQQGRRRRKLLADQLDRIGHDVPHALDVALRDLSNRVQGTVAELRHLVESDHVTDDVLVQRVRSRAGRVLSHPATFQVDVANGVVNLRGAVLAHELEPLLCAVHQVRGVRRIFNDLKVHDAPGTLSSLQGAGSPTKRWPKRPGHREPAWWPAPLECGCWRAEPEAGRYCRRCGVLVAWLW